MSLAPLNGKARRNKSEPCTGTGNVIDIQKGNFFPNTLQLSLPLTVPFKWKRHRSLKGSKVTVTSNWQV